MPGKPKYVFRTQVVRAPSGVWRAQVISYEGLVRIVATPNTRGEAWEILRPIKKKLNEK